MKSKAGQPTKYKKEYNDLAYKFCLLGATDEQLANFLDVAESTINNWKNTQPEFLESIKRGKHNADANVAEALYKRALGYEHKEDKIFNANGKPLIVPTMKHYPPDTAAAFIWLKNRKNNDWRDKQEIEHSGNMEINIGKEFEGF